MRYSAWDKELQQYFATGRHSTTKEECIDNIFEFMIEGDITEEEDIKTMEAWSYDEKLEWLECHCMVEIHEED